MVLFLNDGPVITKNEQEFKYIILYMDLDAFYASVEIRDNPSLVGKPVIIGGNPETKRGVVSTCSYEARKFGIHSGMPINQALELCPEVIILRGNFQLYSQVSKNIMEILEKYSPTLKVSSIDEAYIDITDIVENYEEAEFLAVDIKDEIYSIEKITCSIGIAPNKILAKIASDVNKPNGLTIVKPSEVKDFLSPLDIIKIPGVGKKSKKYFDKLNIKTCGDLAKTPYYKIYHSFGNHGLKLWKLVNGYNTESTEEKFEKRQRKSISKEKTFFETKKSWQEIEIEMRKATEKIIHKAKERRMQFRTVSLKIRDRKFNTSIRSYSLNCYSVKENDAYQAIEKLLIPFKKKYSPKDIRLIGVKISNIIKIPDEQKNLSQFFNNI
ncbi:MAG: DNA polymerase IV [Candidatus Heimdallarchaeaceae archaeon]